MLARLRCLPSPCALKELVSLSAQEPACSSDKVRSPGERGDLSVSCCVRIPTGGVPARSAARHACAAASSPASPWTGRSARFPCWDGSCTGATVGPEQRLRMCQERLEVTTAVPPARVGGHGPVVSPQPPAQRWDSWSEKHRGRHVGTRLS